MLVTVPVLTSVRPWHRIDHKLFIYIKIAYFESVRLEAEDFESEARVELAGGGLLDAYGQRDVLQAELLVGAPQEFDDEPPASPLFPKIRSHINSPQTALVPILGALAPCEPRGADQFAGIKGAEDEALWQRILQLARQGLDGSAAVLFGRLAKGMGHALQRLKAEVPKRVRVLGTQNADLQPLRPYH